MFVFANPRLPDILLSIRFSVIYIIGTPFLVVLEYIIRIGYSSRIWPWLVTIIECH